MHVTLAMSFSLSSSSSAMTDSFLSRATFVRWYLAQRKRDTKECPLFRGIPNSQVAQYVLELGQNP